MNDRPASEKWRRIVSRRNRFDFLHQSRHSRVRLPAPRELSSACTWPSVPHVCSLRVMTLLSSTVDGDSVRRRQKVCGGGTRRVDSNSVQRTSSTHSCRSVYSWSIWDPVHQFQRAHFSHTALKIGLNIWDSFCFICLFIIIIFLIPVLNSQGMKKITLCNTKSTKIKLEWTSLLLLHKTVMQ